MANSDDSGAPKQIIFDFKPLPKATQCEKIEKKQKTELKHSYKNTHQINVRKNGKAEDPVSPMDGVIRCSTCEEEYCDLPTEEWNQCCKCQDWWHEECSNYENGILFNKASPTFPFTQNFIAQSRSFWAHCLLFGLGTKTTF
ncbi:uncharacterized protein TNCV_4130721 [Trichonephila clavipes]|nr:uncharacterized protein TNCV_4130721 [Trichonephila clavipes]